MPIDWLALGAALLAGLMGGVHCAAMCGGIATGFSAMSTRSSWRAAFEPNLGRVLGYTLAGAIVGGLGHGLLRVVRMDWLAWGLRAAVGLVLVMVAVRILKPGAGAGFLAGPAQRLWAALRPLQRHLLPADTPVKRIGLGMLWGWLPCGLSSTMLVAAWLQATAPGGAALMAAFGTGTLVTMLPLSYSGARWLARPGQRRLLGGLMLAAGVLTLAAPWLMQLPALHGVLEALGCLPSGR